MQEAIDASHIRERVSGLANGVEIIHTKYGWIYEVKTKEICIILEFRKK
jgi:hypothetical protein